MGLSQASMLSVFHTDAEDLFNVNNNLEKVKKVACDKLLTGMFQQQA